MEWHVGAAPTSPTLKVSILADIRMPRGADVRVLELKSVTHASLVHQSFHESPLLREKLCQSTMTFGARQESRTLTPFEREF